MSKAKSDDSKKDIPTDFLPCSALLNHNYYQINNYNL